MFYSDIIFRSLLYDVLETVMIQKALQLTILFQLLNDSPSRSFDSMNNQSTVKPPVCSLQLRLRVLPESSCRLSHRYQQDDQRSLPDKTEVQWLLQEDL